MKCKILKSILGVILALILIFAIYMAYVLLSYYRLDDNLTLDVNGTSASSEFQVGQTIRIASANLGFGAYSQDFTFFMDGGTESWAYSKDEVIKNITGSINSINKLNADIIALQEVDTDSTRSYHVNEEDEILSLIENSDTTNYTFAQNYDSPFLFYPFYQPHGKSKAGLLTLSETTITDSIRRSLPIEESLSKLIDLDRCYSKNYFDLDNGKQLVFYNVHLSAYTTDPSTAENQVKMLNEDMMEEYNAGNYCIAAGDMNKDLLGDSSEYFKTTSSAESWAKPFPTELLDDALTLVAPLDEDNPVPSCRNCDVPYSEDCFVITIDGFIVSSNVEVEAAAVLDNQFMYSDHNPVYMDFKLK